MDPIAIYHVAQQYGPDVVKALFYAATIWHWFLLWRHKKVCHPSLIDNLAASAKKVNDALNPTAPSNGTPGGGA